MHGANHSAQANARPSFEERKELVETMFCPSFEEIRAHHSGKGACGDNVLFGWIACGRRD